MASVRPCKFKYFGGLLHAQRDRIGRRRRGSHYTLGLGHSEAGNDALEDGHGHGTDARDDAVQVGEGGGELSSGQWCGVVSIERLGCSSDHLSCFAATRNIVASGHKSIKSTNTRYVEPDAESAAIHARSDRGRLDDVCVCWWCGWACDVPLPPRAAFAFRHRILKEYHAMARTEKQVTKPVFVPSRCQSWLS